MLVRAASRYRWYDSVSPPPVMVRGLYAPLAPVLNVTTMLCAAPLQVIVTVPVESVAELANTSYVPKFTDVVEIVHVGAASALEPPSIPITAAVATSAHAHFIDHHP